MLGSAVLGLTLLAGSAARAHDGEEGDGGGGGVSTGPLMFAKVDGIPGDATLKGHENEIQIFRFSETFRQSVATSGSAGSATGKFTPGPVVFTKVQDRASIDLLRACAKGQHIQTVVITAVRMSKGQAQDYYKITLKDVLVSAINEKSSGDTLVDELQLVYDSARWEVFDPADATEWDGKTGTVSSKAPAPGPNR
jgi:type VI secretion system Hcp family effector